MSVLFRFDHVWSLPARPEDAYAVLADIDGYAAWWPQVRSVRRLGGDSGDVLARSALPISLRLRLTRRREDPISGVLEVEVEGDLQGWCRWVVAAGPTSSDGAATARAFFAQEVTVARPLLAALVPYGRPVLEANHAWMMRGGERGLRALFA